MKQSVTDRKRDATQWLPLLCSPNLEGRTDRERGCIDWCDKRLLYIHSFSTAWPSTVVNRGKNNMKCFCSYFAKRRKIIACSSDF